MHGALDRLKDETRKFLWTAMFFAATFCVVVVTNKLLVKGSDIEIASFGTAIVGGLIVAKVLLLVDLLPFVDAFPGKPLVYNILWKTPIYRRNPGVPVPRAHGQVSLRGRGSSVSPSPRDPGLHAADLLGDRDLDRASPGGLRDDAGASP